VDLKIQEKIELAPYTSWLVGGLADYFCLPSSVEEVREALEYSKKNKLPITVLGGGSNVLISDRGVAGLTICLKKLSGIGKSQEVSSRWVIETLAGTSKTELLKIFLKQKLAPAIFLAGIPGDVAGGVIMNAGVGEKIQPREFVEITDWIEVMRFDGNIERIMADQLHWDYRHCEKWEPGIIVNVGLSWENSPSDSILVQAKAANQLRLTKQPLELPSCGSVFVNPDGGKAAMLIDSCGLKGYTIGKAQVSPKHANFIVNLGGAKSAEIWQLIQYVQKTVKEKANFDLKTEVIKLGRW